MSTEKKDKEKKEVPVTMKGMRDIIGDEYHKYQGFTEKASEIALYYGFQPIETPTLEREEVFISTNSEDTDIIGKEMYSLRTKGGDHLALRPEGTAPVMRAYIEHGMQSLPQPVKLYYSGSFYRHENPQRGRYREFKSFGLEVLGTSRSVADAMVIHMVVTMLREVGLDSSIVVEVNSIGDKECRPAYVRELTAYYRKHVNALCATCKIRIKTNPMRLLDCKTPQCKELKEKAPDSISALCNDCTAHFKEVLEYLDHLDIPYRINNNLVRGLDYYTRTVFEVIEEDGITAEEEAGGAPKKQTPQVTPLTIASGGRYDYLARRLGSKKDVTGVGAGIGIDRVLLSPNFKAINPRIVKKPKIYFIQLGYEAKMRSLEIIEALREAKIPVTHSLNKDSLATQLAIAERLKTPFALILGQKEAMDGTVIVRNMQNRSQDTIPIATLSEYLKKIKWS